VFADIENIDAFAGRKDWCFCRDRKKIVAAFCILLLFQNPPQKNSHTQNPKTLKAKPKTPCCTNQAVKHPTHTLIVRGRVSEFCAVSLVWFWFLLGFVLLHCFVWDCCSLCCNVFVGLFCDFFSFFQLNFALHFWMVAFFSFFFF
jgi:hypothetical protein